MHRALAGRDISTVYRLLCDDGLTQAQISKLTGQSQSEVSEILNGRRVLSYAVLERIADGLGIPRGHMGLAYADADGNLDTYPEGDRVRDTDEDDQEVDDEMISRRILGLVSAALLGASVLGEEGGIRLLGGSPTGTLTTLSTNDAVWIRAATKRFQELDHEFGGAAVYGAALGLAEQVIGALRATQEPSRDLKVAASRLCSEAGWSAYDAGRKRVFWQCQATALGLAKDAGHTKRVLALVEGSGRAEILSGNHQAAAKLFELMSIRKKKFDALDWGLLGDAYAPNSPEAAKGALRHLKDSEGSTATDAISMYGHVSMGLGDYPAAISAFDKVLPQRKGRLVVQETSSLAMAYLKSGETVQGVRHAQSAFTMFENVRSVQTTTRLRRLAQVLASQKDSTAQDLARQIGGRIN
ncbi:MAG: helix-turn-helix domain-containing protein [Pseudonocardiaceae bacterium]